MRRIIDILLTSISLYGILLSIVTLLFKVDDLDKIEVDIQTMVLILAFAAILCLIIAILLSYFESYIIQKGNGYGNSSLIPFSPKFLWLIAIIIVIITAIYLMQSSSFSSYSGLTNIEFTLPINLSEFHFSFPSLSSLNSHEGEIMGGFRDAVAFTLPFNQEEFCDSSFIVVYTFGLTALVLFWSMTWLVVSLTRMFTSNNTFSAAFIAILVPILLIYPVLWGEYVISYLVSAFFAKLYMTELLPSLIANCTINLILGLLLTKIHERADKAV